MRPICVIQAPFATRSGYGDQSREIIRHIIAMDKYDVKLVSIPWGATPMNALSDDNPRDLPIIERISEIPLKLPRQPELFIQITVPNEFKPIGKYNIGITAGIETTLCSPEWIEGMNRMDLILTTSEHSKRVLQKSAYEKRDQSGNPIGQLALEKPIEVLHNCMDTDIFKFIPSSEISDPINEAFDTIEEDFCFLFVGHWLKGGYGEDRKNIGVLVRTFCETFKVFKKKPALILKTSGAGFSILDQEDILGKIRSIKESVGNNCPNVYLLHGNLTEREMNELYNHPKVKVHISFTKGEGFGLPLLQATQSNKPVIASGWSGQLDFLNPQDALLIGGELKKVEPGAVWKGVIVPESEWFNVDIAMAKRALHHAYTNYGRLLDGAYRLAKKCKKQFSIEANREQLTKIFDEYVPKFAIPVPMKLPTLKKVSDNEEKK